MFQLHPKLAADTVPIGQLQLCEARLLNDSRFPWVVLVPMRTRITELHQLSNSEQVQLLEESSQVARCLLQLNEVEKINVAALGNLVPQFHWHIVGRSTEDPCWPGPVWGCGETTTYDQATQEKLISHLQQTLND